MNEKIKPVNGKGKGPEKGRNLGRFRKNYDEIKWGNNSIITGSLKERKTLAIFNSILDDWNYPRL